MDLLDIGYPAYAGIDPFTILILLFVYRLPRIRGDRPQKAFTKEAVEAATPHTRGSTQDAAKAISEAGGYPAYAGIDLPAI